MGHVQAEALQQLAMDKGATPSEIEALVSQVRASFSQLPHSFIQVRAVGCCLLPLRVFRAICTMHASYNQALDCAHLWVLHQHDSEPGS